MFYPLLGKSAVDLSGQPWRARRAPRFPASVVEKPSEGVVTPSERLIGETLDYLVRMLRALLPAIVGSAFNPPNVPWVAHNRVCVWQLIQSSSVAHM
jgi:hypothetical protein